MATTTPFGSPWGQAAQKQHAGRSRCTRRHLLPGSVFPGARHGRYLPRCGEL